MLDGDDLGPDNDIAEDASTIRKIFWRRLIGAFTIATAYVLLWAALGNLADHDSLFSTMRIAFLIALPTAICAFVTFVLDPMGRRSFNFYVLVPCALVMVSMAAAIIVFKEGAICIIMLMPLWGVAAGLGGLLAYWISNRLSPRAGRIHANALLILPLIVMQIEHMVPPTLRTHNVVSEITINANAKDVWPLLMQLDDLSPDEGQWNFTQNIAGIPRPRSAIVTSVNGTLVRKARWGDNIRFEEHIDHLVEGQSIGWTFVFPDDSLRLYTDRHISPEGPAVHIKRGGYRLEALADNRSRLILTTQYQSQSHLWLYGQLWGNVFLGDVQDNVLQIIKDRAEAKQTP